jgi:hypothetical protein
MRVKVLRALWYAGEMRNIGAELELPDQLARESIYNGKVERVTDAPKAAEPKAGPMTTSTAPDLVGGKKTKGAQ